MKGLALTSQSMWPWKSFCSSVLTTMGIPAARLAGAKVVSSTHPLNTDPDLPWPSALSGRKFMVASLRSLKAKLRRSACWRISPSLLGVTGIVVDCLRKQFAMDGDITNQAKLHEAADDGELESMNVSETSHPDQASLIYSLKSDD